MAAYIKQNDTSPSLRATLQDANQVPVNLTGASVIFHMQTIGASTPTVSATATIESPTEGLVRYDWVVGDTASSGNFQAEFQVTFADGSVETFPNTGYLTVRILPEIA